MIPETAKKLLPLVNTKKIQDALLVYALERIEFVHRQLEIATSWDEVKDLEHSLMAAYQDYESIVESLIIIKNDWDERR